MSKTIQGKTPDKRTGRLEKAGEAPDLRPSGEAEEAVAFSLRANKARRYKTTLVVESESQDELNKALADACVLARERVMYMSFHYRDNSARVSCRTTRMRGKKSTG